MKQFLKTSILSLLILLLFNKFIYAQKEFDDIRGTQHWMRFTDAPNSLYHYLANQAYFYLNKRSDEISRINSLSEWKQRQQWIKNTLKETVGPFPQKTPLNARITNTFSEDGYHLEDIVYESQPNYYVTSTLFIPDNLKNGKAPAIVYCSGHSNNGYRADIYQHEILNLVKKGFVVFAFDPMGQGERLQYFNPETNKSIFKYPSYEHSYPGAQLFITGNTLAGDFIWDGIRAVDYLLTRKEVDPARIGITGGSGGGTQSAYIAAFDNRIMAAAPRNYFTNFTRLYESMGPQDAEQNFFYGIKRGIDMADLLLARAPKPVLMVTTSRDMFPIQGAIETAKEVARLYQAYGKQQNFGIVTDDAPHASTKSNREAFYAFFQKFLDNPGDSTDQETKSLPENELKVTATGQLATSLKGETAFSLNRKDAEKRMEKLESERKDFPAYLTKMLASAKKLSGYEEPKSNGKSMFAGRIQRDGYVIEKYLIKGEGNYMIPYLLLKPETPNGKALIYLNPMGKTADAGAGEQMEWFVKNNITVLAPDIVGTGELGPGIFHGDSYIDSVSYNLWFASMLIGRSIVGIQAGDVVRLSHLLENQLHFKEIYGLAIKQMAPVLLHAAAFHKNIKKLALISPYSSYRSIVMNHHYDPHFIQSTVAGSIGIYDLPDLAASISPNKILITGVSDGTGNTENVTDIDKDMSVIRAACKHKNASKQLQILPTPGVEKLTDILKSWLAD
ncbi:prolyl oligopeptidase family serine peptidase [Ginsengibacter hankyongi]|uniref:Prolyl oligopeptidase family serine peptidase n=1 Tax=Ginsengibacter hankyongi TaxID=2607284 RepID=A0A5J5IG94_9BACT|nr:acetylxylan esterase [Ginsengibacter hankyongi]KAA9038684.1 prolyl oligopeptidase family serine peptidase [Ginsengibacter hankyongi]